ncbi:MAG TPA: isocitrate lyase/phosphoenolpyruvate mutase family protein [Steroidobacteraceae bacterium]|nr:isocitrate lyase/phosphoenolpyruvate mutase family protein [Steroidobacteraceae bacterium]HQX46983.1 isocitrate lyase/phosphoenolpyruvate mutase family protein [Steroidobacteraceae bacterium]HQZ78991.1 isocitrate lyase/phosphoenolpyruvate mutase family protein [Steroidobacteraceae bacterium]
MTDSLSTRLAALGILVAPGCYDALSASLIERAGFCAAYLSGASIAYTRFGRPDIGLVGMSEVAEVVSQIRERVAIPLIVDADTGFGNALNVQRTMQLFERSGASAIQLEDQQLPKRCGHLAGKTLVSAREMAGKIRAACDARRSHETLVIGRTDALAVEGLDAALDRAEDYLAAGADILFIEALPDLAAMQRALARFKGRAPLLANMVEGGKSPLLPAGELERLGFSIAIFPGAMVRVQTFAAQRYLETLKRDGTTQAMLGEMLDFRALNELLGTEQWLERGKRYE